VALLDTMTLVDAGHGTSLGVEWDAPRLRLLDVAALAGALAPGRPTT
jgi:hypothetical protein